MRAEWACGFSPSVLKHCKMVENCNEIGCLIRNSGSLFKVQETAVMGNLSVQQSHNRSLTWFRESLTFFLPKIL